MGISIPATYLVLAPASAPVPGLGLGALGVALKMVVIQVAGVNVQAWVIARANGWRYRPGYQAGVLAALLGLGGACRAASGAAFGPGAIDAGSLSVAAAGGALYIALSLALVYYLPGMAGVTREKILTVLRGRHAAAEALKTV
jgi:hypothetical protein